MRFFKSLCIILFLFFSEQSISSSFSFFEKKISSEPIKIQLKGNLSELFNIRLNETNIFDSKKNNIDAQVTFLDETNQINRTFAVKVSMRGNLTLWICPVPKIEILFNKEDRIELNMKSIDLNTHCAEPDTEKNLKGEVTPVMKSLNKEELNRREHIAYQILKVLNIESFQSRYSLVEYIDTSATPSAFKNGKIYPALLKENTSGLKKRIQAISNVIAEEAVMIDEDDLSAPRFDHLEKSSQIKPMDVTRIALAEALIGNGDWFFRLNSNHFRYSNESGNSPERFYNLKILQMSPEQWKIIPYDFNFATLVAGYPVVVFSDARYFNLLNDSEKNQIYEEFVNKKQQLEDLQNLFQEDAAGKENYKKILSSFFSHPTLTGLKSPL